MRLSLGFVSICLSEKSCSPAGSVTYRSIQTLDPESQRLRIARTARRNLENTLRILWFMDAHAIELYRISATMIPLATHPVTDGWAWWEESELVEVGRRIGTVARERGYRLSSHLPEVCGFTSSESYKWMCAYLEYHRRLFDLMGLGPDTRIVVHVGGAYGNKGAALRVARTNIDALDPWARERLALENDDRTYTLEDVTTLAGDTGLAVVCDWHHHVVNSGGRSDPDEIRPLIEAAGRLRGNRPLKVHVSSPKNSNQVRAHADYVDIDFVRPFFDLLTTLDASQIDVMVEAKQKDLALLQLRDQLRQSAAAQREGM